jgi:hypothetical protein
MGTAGSSGTVSGKERARFFEEAIRKLPRNVRINTILMPMEGDPRAASAYWQLARATGGSYMNPSLDWP